MTSRAVESPWLVVGLGNPGEQFARTRHNVGAMAIDAIAVDHRDRLTGASKLRSDTCQLRMGGVAVVLATPRSYMNESGGPVRLLCNYYAAPPERLVVVHDDLDLAFGAIKVKLGGGDGGHNGLRSIRSSLGTGDYVRLRVGIGRPPGRQDPADFVLRPFTGPERDALGAVLADVGQAVQSVVLHGVEATQNAFHGRVVPDG